MSVMSNIANIFRPTQQVTQLPQVNPGAAMVVPPSGTANPTPSNPLDEFTSIWQNDPTSQPTIDPLSTPLFNTDPAKINAAAGKIDFVSQVPQELLAKAMSGNDPQAFMQVMNTIAQRTLATATQLNAATLEQATVRNNERITNALPGRIKNIQLNAMVSENPVLSHPASQPLLQMVRAQIQMKEPGLSAADINKRAEHYLSGFAGQLAAPAAEAELARTKTAGTDWDT